MLRRLARFAWRLVRGGIHQLPLAVAERLLEASASAVAANGPNFVTLRKRPKSGSESPYRSVNLMLPCKAGEIGVVVQGPILQKDNFTIESLRYYRTLCPEFTLILSTWDDELAAVLDQARELGVEVVVSEKPTVAGRNNINYQVKSSVAGLKRAEELGCRYAAKTRTDHRLYGVQILRALPLYLRLFPQRNTPDQAARLIAVSRATSKFAPYNLSDFFMFGLVRDVLSYWSMPTDATILSREESDKRFWRASSFAETSQLSPECILLMEYLKRATVDELEYSIPAWWRTLADRLLIVDWADLDIYWPKYQPFAERPDIDAGIYHLAGNQVSFADWLALYLEAVDAQANEALIGLAPHMPAPIRTEDLLAKVKVGR